MGKKVVKLNVGDIKNIVNECINELTNYDDWIDISTLDKEDLDSAKIDLRLIPHAVSFDDIICNVIEDKQYLMESAGDSLPPDDVIENIVNKYQLDRRLIKKVERANKIYVYVITALIGENVDMIKNDMEIMGYFFGHSGREYLIDGQKYIQLQFEPYCQLQQDITDEIKTQFNALYHWTPEYHLDDIMTQGLIPLHENKVFNYPPRIYLIKGDVSFNDIKMLGDGLSRINDNENNNGCYVLLGIELSELDYDIKFYYDPNYRNGVFTEQRIPPEYIKVITREKFKTSLKPPLK